MRLLLCDWGILCFSWLMMHRPGDRQILKPILLEWLNLLENLMPMAGASETKVTEYASCGSDHRRSREKSGMMPMWQGGGGARKDKGDDGNNNNNNTNNTVTALLVSGTGGTWSSPKAVFVSHLLSMVWVVCVDAGADDAQ